MGSRTGRGCWSMVGGWRNTPGANLGVVELFSFLHDSQRQSDGTDPEHGPRAAQWINSLNGRFFSLDEHELQLFTNRLP